MPNVPMTNVNAYYSNTAPGNVILSNVIDAAIQDIVQAINDNWAIYDTFVTSITLPIPDQSIVEKHIRNLAITNPKLAPSAVTNDKIMDSTITAAKLADLLITTSKLADLSVTNGKLVASAVTGDKIASLTITTDKLQDLLITTGKLSDQSVTESKLGTGSVSTRTLADRSVTAGKLDPSLINPISDAGIQYKFGLIDEQLADIVTVKPSGDTTGETDTAVIQELLDSGTGVKLARGIFYNKGIRISGNHLNFSGRGIGQTVLKTVAPSGFAIVISKDSPSEFVTIKDLQIEGVEGAQGGLKIGDEHYAAFVRIENVKISNFSDVDACGVSLEQLQEVNFINCDISYNYYNVYRGTTGYITSTTFQGRSSYIGRSIDKGIYLKNGKLEIYDVIIESNKKEIYYNPAGTTAWIEFHNCYFENNNIAGGEALFVALGSSAPYRKSTIKLIDCEHHNTTNSIVMKTNYTNVFIKDNLGLYDGNALAVDTVNTYWFIETNISNTAVDFYSTYQSLLGFVFAKELNLGQGACVNYTNRGHVFSGHIVSSLSGLPIADVTSALAAGSSASVVLSPKSTDTCGQISLTLGDSGWSTTPGSLLCTVTFNKGYYGSPIVVLTPADLTTARAFKNGIYVENTNSERFRVRIDTPLTVGGVLKINYMIMANR